MQTQLRSRVAVAVLWLWRRPVAAARIQPLALEQPYATGPKKQKSKEKTLFTIAVKSTKNLDIILRKDRQND